MRMSLCPSRSVRVVNFQLFRLDELFQYARWLLYFLDYHNGHPWALALREHPKPWSFVPQSDKLE